MKLDLSKLPQGYDWLLRTNARDGYFCQITIMKANLPPNSPRGEQFRVYSNTPQGAIDGAINEWAAYAASKVGEQR